MSRRMDPPRLAWRERAARAAWANIGKDTSDTADEPQADTMGAIKAAMIEALPQFLELPAKQLAMHERQTRALEAIAGALQDARAAPEAPAAGWNTCFAAGCGHVWPRRFAHNMRARCPKCGETS